MTRPCTLLACTLALTLTACGGAQPASSDGAEDLTAAAYQDADEQIYTSGGDADRWRALKAQLAADFDQVCGDTFCEGDYSNLRPLSLRCSVSLKTSAIKACKYVFAGSYEAVTANTGNVKVTAKAFSCAFTTTATPKALMDALLSAGPTPALRRPLPGSTRSIYDSLVGCL